MLNYKTFKNEETYKNEYSLTGLDFDQVYFIRTGLQHEIQQLKNSVNSYKVEIEELSKRDVDEQVSIFINKTVSERLTLCCGILESSEETLQKLEKVYDVLQAK